MNMKPINLKIQNYHSQTGILKNPVFLWQYGFGNHKQTAYKIVIGSDNDFKYVIYETEKVKSDEQNNICIQFDFLPQSIYYYRIIVWDENNISYTSDTANFITGVDKWEAKWISDNSVKPFYARKYFDIDEIPNTAIICVCGLGQYELHINDTKISEDVLNGSWTDYNKRVEYNTYDIKSYLKKGKNKIVAEIANGWYIGDTSDDRHFYTLDKGYEPFGKSLPFIAQLKLDNSLVVTDESWEVIKSATTLANVYGSEDFDGEYFSGVNTFKWNMAKVLSEVPKGVLTPMKHPTIKVINTYETKSVTPLSNDTYIFDLGQNMSGQFEICGIGKKGQQIKVTPVEKLNSNGEIERTTDTWSYYTFAGTGDMECFCPKFSYVGARWVQIEKCTIDKSNEDVPYIDTVRGHFISSSAENVGKFKCSDEDYNAIYNIILKAIESNLNHCHTDCPTIEKLGWLEPTHLMAKSVMYNKNVDTLWSKIANDMRDSQYTEDEYDVDNGSFPHEYGSGLIPSISPRYAKFITDWNHSGSFWDIIPWGSSILIAALEQYRFYGNVEVIRDNYVAAKRYVDYITRQYNDYNRLYNKTGEEKFICAGLGDWGIMQNGGESRENIETAFYYYDIKVLAQFANILGYKDEEKIYLNQAEKVKELYNKTLLRKNTKTERWFYYAYDCEDLKVTQTNQAIPLYFGMVPDDMKKDVEQSLLESCESEHFDSGEIGLSYIIRCLSMMDEHDLLHRMITQEEHPSYLRFVKTGETTLPEFWRDDARSRNHDMMGHIMEWFFTDIAGITSDDGFKTLKINPKTPSHITNVECEFNSIRGKIKVESGRNGGDIRYPSNMNVEFSNG